MSDATTVEAAEAAIGNLESKRAALVARGEELATVRASYAFAAHAKGDKAARAKLDQINKETVEHSSELASIDAALKTANERLVEAKQHEAKAVDRERAQAIRAELKNYVEAGRGVHTALCALIEEAGVWASSDKALRNLGVHFPSDQQVRVLGTLALHSSLMQLPPYWNREVGRHLAPTERQDFDALVTKWAATIAASAVTPYLGAEETETEEAA